MKEGQMCCPVELSLLNASQTTQILGTQWWWRWRRRWWIGYSGNEFKSREPKKNPIMRCDATCLTRKDRQVAGVEGVPGPKSQVLGPI